MAALRNLSHIHRRWLLLFVAALLCARALVPAGWMPVAGPHGVTLAFCDGGGPMPPMVRMTPMKHGAAPMEHHRGAPDHPCDFASAAVAFALATPVVTPLPPVLRDRPTPARPTVTIGQGLAAPPPPPTGPPAFA